MAQVVLLSDLTQIGDEIGYSRAIGPYILASKLREAGFSCVVLDYLTHIKNFSIVLDSVLGPETLLVGFSSTFLSLKTFPSEKNNFKGTYYDGYLWFEKLGELQHFLLEIRRKLSENNSSAAVVIGGSKSLMAIQNPEMRSLFDFFIIGKGESFIVKFVQQLKNQENIPFTTYEGARFLHESNYGVTTETVHPLRWVDTDAVLKGESLPLEIAKGCLYNCKFCHFDKQGSIRQELQALKDQLIANYEMYGTTVYHFCDDCFNDTREKVETICELFLSLPFRIEWVSYVRVDVAVKFPHTLDLMIESGARGLFWGIETFDYKVARQIGKGTDPLLVQEMLVSLKRRHGDRVLCSGSFIVGLPGETEESLWKTNEWIINRQALDDVSYFPLGLRPYSERLDKAVIDYADYSRNPQKYGFKSISFSPYYWEHETMNSQRAADLKTELMVNLKKNGLMRSFAQSVFQYPFFRTLGLNHSDIVDLYKKHTWYDGRYHEIRKLEKDWRKTYHRKLLESL